MGASWRSCSPRDGVLTVLVAVGVLLTLIAANAAFRVRVALPRGPRPQRPVLFYNPRSGGGKAERLGLAAEARARGIEPVELAPGEDLAELVRDAVSRGADALAMAGGDGSQAIVAAIAAEHSLPYACVPRVPATISRSTSASTATTSSARSTRLSTAASASSTWPRSTAGCSSTTSRSGSTGRPCSDPSTATRSCERCSTRSPTWSVPSAREQALRWTDPDGGQCESRRDVLVSNNRYRLGKLIGSGTRPHLDDGLLGIVVVGEQRRACPPTQAPRPWREWTAPSFTVQAGERVPAGIDGEAAQLEPPLRFRTGRAREGPDRASAPRRLTVGDRARRRVGRAPGAGAIARPWAATGRHARACRE